MFVAARDGFEDISSSALDISVSYAVRRRFVGQSSKKPYLADLGRYYVLGFLGFSSFYASARVITFIEDLLATFSFLSAFRPLAVCDLLASLRWPCYAGFPGAPTRRCRVRLQRPSKVYNELLIAILAYTIFYE